MMCSPGTASVRHNRPNCTAFAQQSMRSVQFVLDWKKTLTASLAIGLLFSCMGFGDSHTRPNSWTYEAYLY